MPRVDTQFKPGEKRVCEKPCIKCGAAFTTRGAGRYCPVCLPRSLHDRRGNTPMPVRCPKCLRMREVKGGGKGYAYAADGTRERTCLECVLGAPVIRTSKESRLLLRDRDWMERAYADHSSNEIGEFLGCGFSTVCQWLRRHGIPRRTIGEALLKHHSTKGQKGGRNRQMVTGGVADAHVRITQKDWIGG